MHVQLGQHRLLSLQASDTDSQYYDDGFDPYFVHEGLLIWALTKCTSVISLGMRMALLINLAMSTIEATVVSSC
jgi:hypothetical protein